MAYPEEVVPPLPETLPEDFSDWDGEASPAPLPGISTEVDNGRVHSEAPRPRGQASYRDAVRASASRAQRMWGSNPPEPSFGRQQSELSSWQRETSAASMSRNSGEVEVTHALSENAEPLGQSAEREVLLSPAVDRPRDSRAASSATAAATPKMSTTGLAEELPNYVSQSLDDSQAVKGASAKTGSSATAIADGARNIPEISAAKMREADEAIYQLFSVKNVEVAQKQKPSRNKWVMVAAVGGLSILLSFALTLLLGHHGAKAAANLPVQSFSGATVTLVKANAAKPSAGEPLAQGQLQAVAGDQQAPDNLQTQANDGASSAPTITQAQTQMMNDQLAAPRMIPQGATKQVAEDT
ncbi:MAG TPA: hypothetical protein VHD85_06855, partial [Terracidiphilus sp.]|nr:hypothetical protein [Terracidiphilus sp.]